MVLCVFVVYIIKSEKYNKLKKKKKFRCVNSQLHVRNLKMQDLYYPLNIA